jgi:hypothetical protein
VALGADGLLDPTVAGEAGRVMTLSSGGADLFNVRVLPGCLDQSMAAIARGSRGMRPVPEIVEGRWCPKTGRVFHRDRLVGVTD